MKPLSITELKTRVAFYEDAPQRTTALEQRIRIGIGFHDKWYGSQREHMLGWLVVQECQTRKNEKDPCVQNAQGTWNRLKCSPLMFWLAECAQVSDKLLDRAEEEAIKAAAINPKDGNPHGVMMRTILPWPIMVDALAKQSIPRWNNDVELESREAFERLSAKVTVYKPLKQWLPN